MKSVTIFCVNIVIQKEEYQITKNVDFSRFLKHIDSKKIMSVTM
jgi:hypothetical protein